jgi:4-hydroxymandelate oxidase
VWDLSNFVSLIDFQEHALAVLPRTAADYFRSGAWGEVTLRENCLAWERMQLHYRVLVDVSTRQLATTILGAPASMPVVIAPTALQCMAHSEGELATVCAAGVAGVPMILSCLSTTSVDDVCRAATGPVWMQLYLGKDRGFVRDLAQRAHGCGCSALVLTVDNPVWGMREQDVRNHFCVPAGMRIVNLERPGGPTGHTGRGIGESLGWAIDDSLTWKDFEWLRDATPLPVVVKGICRPDDAAMAVKLGARGVMVSNHGGRQLDTAPATADVLEPIAQAVAGRAEVLVDGGIRRGTDVLKALALGATGVAIGRPVLWGLATAGQAGVARVLQLLRSEIDTAMALSGVADVCSVPRDLVVLPNIPDA